MKKNKEQPNKGEIVIYGSGRTGPEIRVRLENETVWLTQAQIAELFDAERSVVTKHIRNIFKDGELNEKSVCAIFAHTAADGKTYKTAFYSLDLIISVGYRVNSKRATQFRIWANRVLKEYLVRGYAVNEKRLAEARGRLDDLKIMIEVVELQGECIHASIGQC